MFQGVVRKRAASKMVAVVRIATRLATQMASALAKDDRDAIQSSVEEAEAKKDNLQDQQVLSHDKLADLIERVTGEQEAAAKKGRENQEAKARR
jgi:hypothetical protein